ncbi:DUF167 domain-containing protein [Arenibaculum pallidiluteum]|uniref:DUF167 domain-containing protein n=1 Tax=Arenibaculum pallidiluteum TaxID=2812559 RepID=UPI002E2B0413|nr:DUF167 domain-containing protein [Arenibaculum pallidiluteum]
MAAPTPAGPGWLRETPEGLRAAIRLTPRAAREGVQGLAETVEGGRQLKVSVTAVPEAGKANAALVRLLAKAWGLPPSSLSVVSGATDRNKVVAVAGDAAVLRARLESWLAGLGGGRA